MKQMTPKEARTFNQICDLPRDNISFPKHWFSIGEGHVTIAEQKIGEPAKAMIDLSREVFEAIIRWYETGNKASVELGSKGGIVRAKKLTPARRKEIATKASHSRKKK